MHRACRAHEGIRGARIVALKAALRPGAVYHDPADSVIAPGVVTGLYGREPTLASGRALHIPSVAANGAERASVGADSLQGVHNGASPAGEANNFCASWTGEVEGCPVADAGASEHRTL